MMMMMMMRCCSDWKLYQNLWAIDYQTRNVVRKKRATYAALSSDRFENYSE